MVQPWWVLSAGSDLQCRDQPNEVGVKIRATVPYNAQERP